MDNNKFLEIAKRKVEEYYDGNLLEPPFIVWSCKTLQNNKALLGTSKNTEYFEITYNGDKKEMYIDVYRKIHNIKINEY